MSKNGFGFLKERAHLRFSLSFLSVLVLPIAFFSVLFLKNYREIYEEMVLEQAKASLQATTMELERDIEALEVVINYNQQHSYMQDYAIKKAHTSGEIRSALNATTVTNSILQDVCYYNEVNPNVVYTTQGTYSLNYYAKLYAGLADENVLRDQWDEIGNRGWWVTWKSNVENAEKSEVLHYVIKSSKQGRWIFTLSKERLKEILFEENSKTNLLDSKGNQIYPLLQEVETDIQKYSKISSVSPRGYFTLERFVDNKYLYLEVDRWQSYFLLMVVLVLLLGGILVLFLTFYNGYPIRKLQDYCIEKVRNIPDTIKGFEIFRFAMKSMEEQVILLEDKQRQNQLLLRLLYGGDEDSSSLKTLLSQIGIMEHAECYCVIIVTFEKGFKSDADKLSLYFALTREEEYEFYLLDGYLGSSAVIIAGMKEKAKELLAEKLEVIAATIQADLGKKIWFFVGEIQTELEKIHSSYVSAMVCSQRDINSNVSVYVYKQSRGKKYEYPNEKLSELYDALVAVDLNKAERITTELTDVLKAVKESRFVSLALYYDILNTYYRAQTKLKLDTGSAFLDIDLLEVKDNVNAIYMIHRIRDQFKTYVEQNDKGEPNEHLISRVVMFIEENKKSADLTVGLVADSFDISISNLSHQFKGYMDRTISDYINEKKFLHAKELLLETEDSVQMIATRIGYSQTASFIRKFKKYYGMTPVEYRMTYGSEKNEQI